MSHTGALRGPLFELGLKGYLHGRKAVELAKVADRISRDTGVTLIYTPQIVDIRAVAEATQHVLVCCPHLDPVLPGRGSGCVLAEAVKEAGAHAVLLNHAERPVTMNHMARAIQRAKEVGLLTIVCADSPEEAAAQANLGPDIILAEPSDLIGGTKSVASEKKDFIAHTLKKVRSVNPQILVFNSAGIRTPEDAAAVILAGADGTGSTSGVLTSSVPAGMLEAMVRAVRKAWDSLHA